MSENLLSCKQYGFISGRSTTTQLLSYLDKCIETIVTGGVVDPIYFDFAKSFDTVPHRRLLGKLSCYGISGNIINWIKAFLLGRSQVVRVNGEKSEETAVLRERRQKRLVPLSGFWPLGGGGGGEGEATVR